MPVMEVGVLHTLLWPLEANLGPAAFTSTRTCEARPASVGGANWESTTAKRTFR